MLSSVASALLRCSLHADLRFPIPPCWLSQRLPAMVYRGALLLWHAVDIHLGIEECPDVTAHSLAECFAASFPSNRAVLSGAAAHQPMDAWVHLHDARGGRHVRLGAPNKALPGHRMDLVEQLYCRDGSMPATPPP